MKRAFRLTSDQRTSLRDLLERTRPELASSASLQVIDDALRKQLESIVVKEMLSAGLEDGPNGAELSKYGEQLDDLVGAIVDPV